MGWRRSGRCRRGAERREAIDLSAGASVGYAIQCGVVKT